MRVAIVRYPGSNCDIDTKLYFEDSFYIWHTVDYIDEKYDLLVIPGGFAFGDRFYEKATHKYSISPGKMALQSPVSKLIMDTHKKNIPILGICNGFQILTQMGLLPGFLEINKSKKFESRLETCIFNDGKSYSIPIANSFGNFSSPIDTNYLVFLRYKDGNVAGISNLKKNVFGMMPHPERVRNNVILKEKLLSVVLEKKIIDQSKIEKIMSSEHVSYKSTKKYLSKLYTEGSHVIQGPGENAGIIDIGDGYALFMRIESHNHPIFIEPFQGAATGVGGILRDIFTMGARPIALFDFLRFGNDEKSDWIERETINGISYYGNCVGVPNLGGDYVRDPAFNKNPLLNVGCIGIGKKEDIIYGNALNEDSYFVYIGSKTGSDGIGGADMASKEFGDDQKVDPESIQKGDPFLEKLLLELCCEIKDIEGMQDMGAGGLLCASLEMIERGRKKTNKNLGGIIYIEKVPKKHDHMTNTDIMISESQERMLLVCSQKKTGFVIEKCRHWDLEFSIVGKITCNGKYVITDDGREVYSRNIEDFSSYTEEWDLKKRNISDTPRKQKTEKKKWEVYDNTLGGRTINGPLDDGSYSIIRLYEIEKDLYVTWGSNVEECYQKLKGFGVEGKAVVNCLNFGHPEQVMFEFNECIERISEECKKYNIPVIGGNVSLYNSTNGVSIPPTPVIMMIGYM